MSLVEQAQKTIARNKKKKKTNLVKQAQKSAVRTNIAAQQKVVENKKQEYQANQRAQKAEQMKRANQANHAKVMKAYNKANESKTSGKGGRNKSDMSNKSIDNVYKQQAKTIANTKSGQVYAGVINGLMGVDAQGKHMSKDDKAKMKKTKAYGTGETVGTILSYVGGYGAAGESTAKVAGKIVASNVGKKVVSKAAATKVAKAVAKKNLTKAGKIVGEKAVKNESKKVAEKVIKEVAKDTVADATVGTVLDSRASRKSGHNIGSKEWAKDMGENALMNLGIGGAMDVLPTVLKSVKGVNKSKGTKKIAESIKRAEVKPKSVNAFKETVKQKEARQKLVKSLESKASKKIDNLSKDMKYQKTEANDLIDMARVRKNADVTVKRKPTTKTVKNETKYTKKQIAEAKKDFDTKFAKDVEEKKDYIKNYKGKGVTTTLYEDVDGKMQRYNISNNDLWYTEETKKGKVRLKKRNAEKIATRRLSERLDEYKSGNIGRLMLDDEITPSMNTLHASNKLEALQNNKTIRKGKADLLYDVNDKNFRLKGAKITKEMANDKEFMKFINSEEGQKAINEGYKNYANPTQMFKDQYKRFKTQNESLYKVKGAFEDADFKKYRAANNINFSDIAKAENKPLPEVAERLYKEFKETGKVTLDNAENTAKKAENIMPEKKIADIDNTLENNAIEKQVAENIVDNTEKQAIKNTDNVAKQTIDNVAERTKNIDDTSTLKSMADNTAKSTNEPEKIAQVTTRTVKEKETLKTKLSNAWKTANTKLTDSAYSLHKLGERTGDKQIDALVDKVRSVKARASAMISGEGQYLSNGTRVGKSEKEIFDPIMKRGDEVYDLFQEYMFNKANLDAAAEGKVFGQGVTAEDSAKAIAAIEKQYPEFKESANEVYNFLDNLMKIRVESGLASQDMADTLKGLYEHYVPKHRNMDMPSAAITNGSEIKLQDGIKKFKGSNQNLAPLHEQIAEMTRSTLQASSLNELGLRVAKHLENDVDVIKATPVNVESEAFGEFVKDKDGMIPKTLTQNGNEYSFIIKENGIPYEMKVDKEYFEAFKDLADGSPVKKITGLYKANSLFRNLVTGYNPMFLVRNGLRDFPDAFAFTQQTKPQFIKNYGKAWKEIMTNGEMWQRYKGIGGTGGSFFDIADEWANGTWQKLNPLKKLEMVNQAVEQAPRFGEFVGLLEKGYTPEQALLGAHDLTVNFGRSGQWTRALNSNGATFLNAGVQDLVRIQRTLKSGRVLPLLEGVCIAGIAPSVINELLCGDDPNYQALRTQDKDVNFYIPIGDGEFLKIPKGRFVASMSALPTKGVRALQGNTDENTIGEFIKNTVGTAVGQLAPNNPLESNLLAPIQAMRTNKTWYGTDIETRSDENLPEGERYDEGTTELSKFIGDKLNISPKKLDYALKQYSGVVGQVTMPLMTKKAEGNIVKNNFVTDAVTSNRIGTDYYNKLDELMQNKSSKNGTVNDEVKYKFINNIQNDIDGYNKKIREIQNSNITDKEKLKQIRDIREKMNSLEKSQLLNYKKFEKNVESARKSVNKKDFSNDKNYQTAIYRRASIDTIGAEKTLQNEYGGTKQGQKKLAKIKKAKVDANDYYNGLEAASKYESFPAKVIAMHEAGIDDYKTMATVNGSIYESTYNKAVDLYNQGYTTEEIEKSYAKKADIKQSADSSGNGYLSKAEIQAYINKSAKSQSQARLLWATLAPSNWNNPY